MKSAVVRVGPQIFSDPFQDPTPSAQAVEGAQWPQALQGLAGAVESWSFPPTELGSFLSARSPETARLVLTNAAGTLGAIAKRIERRGVDKSTTSALLQAAKTVDQALAPATLGHATDIEAHMLEAALRTLSDALAPHAEKNQHTEALAEQLHLALARPSNDDVAEELVLEPHDGGLFLAEPESDRAPLRILHEGAIDDDVMAQLIALAGERPLQLADLEGESAAHLWRGPKGEVRCDDVALVAKHPQALELATVGSVDALDDLLTATDAHGLSRVHLHLDTDEALPAFGAALVALEAVSNREPNHTVTVRDASDNLVFTAKPTPQGWSIQLPAVPKVQAAEVDGVIGRALDQANVAELTFDGVGFSRTASGEVQPQVPRGKELRQVFRSVAPILAHQTASALGLGEGKQGRAVLRPFFRDAVDHLNNTKDEEAVLMRDASAWVSAIKEMAAYAASSPARKDKLLSVFTKIVRRSESPANDGFGNALFRGHARARNAFDLVRGVTASIDEKETDTFLAKAEALFDLNVRGAVVGLARDAVLSEDRKRRNSARTEERCLRALAGQADAVRTATDKVMVAVLPTDRTHGRSKTPTPDFFVRRSGKSSNAEVAVDAKARAAIGILERGDTGVSEAANQVFGHRFGEMPADEGLIMLDVYGGSHRDRSEVLARIQSDLDAESGSLWVQVSLRPEDGPSEVVTLRQTGQAQAELPTALRPGAVL
ncbi:MAG: hypothetical protein RMA76_22370 [Deltaproteobacteria bacterium]|jgi:hypothetical protein